MNSVRILPPEIVSKIAAGEVIDRPASVIKELLENAIDAGTKSVELDLQQAGKTLIRLKDTGTGITSADIEQIFHRHATSKIANIDDLFSIHSLGFRGEALYSIAAVADIILRSKAVSEDSGWEIHLRGGERLSLKPASIPSGTEVEVQELFFNTPARRKFLKSNTSEMNQILNIVVPYGILHPSIRFHLRHQDKVILDLLPAEDLVERAAGVLNLDAGHILQARHDQPERDLSIRLIMGDMNIVRSRRDMQFIFVNNRPVQNNSISYHLNDIFRLVLPPRNYPFFALFLQIPAADVDANIHPTKREVKIRDERDICSLLRRIAEKTLMEMGAAKDIIYDAPQDTAHAPQKTEGHIVDKALRETYQRGTPLKSESPDTDPRTDQARFVTEQYSFPQAEAVPAAQISETLFGPKPDTLRGKLENGRYLGSFLNKYLLFEADKSMLVLDQHAAQERISFEFLIQQMEKGQIEAQQLLSPYLIRLAPQDLMHWEESRQRLEEIGFATTQFDDETIAVHTYPVLIKDPQKAVQDILSGGDVVRCDHETLARRACRASIMAGDPLDPRQAVFMREQLLNCRDPFTCPHGRPTVVEMKEDFFNKQFLR